MKIWITLMFAAMCLVQWYVPGAMIAGQEDLLANGKVYRFRTEPVDPTDPFRGKYITLAFDISRIAVADSGRWRHARDVVVVLKEDSDGFAAVDDVRELPPEDDVDFVKAEVMFAGDDFVRVRYPFERFYLEESKAPAAETIYREGSDADSTHTAYALVRVKGGEAAVQDVLIDDRSIVEIAKERSVENR